MDTREEKQSRNAGEAVRGRSRKKSGHFKLSPSKAITISALLAAGLLSAYGLSKHRTAVKTQNIYRRIINTWYRWKNNSRIRPIFKRTINKYVRWFFRKNT